MPLDWIEVTRAAHQLALDHGSRAHFYVAKLATAAMKKCCMKMKNFGVQLRPHFSPVHQASRECNSRLQLRLSLRHLVSANRVKLGGSRISKQLASSISKKVPLDLGSTSTWGCTLNNWDKKNARLSTAAMSERALNKSLLIASGTRSSLQNPLLSPRHH